MHKVFGKLRDASRPLRAFHLDLKDLGRSSVPHQAGILAVFRLGHERDHSECPVTERQLDARHVLEREFLWADDGDIQPVLAPRRAGNRRLASALRAVCQR
jgi:hypothetical protein